MGESKADVVKRLEEGNPVAAGRTGELETLWRSKCALLAQYFDKFDTNRVSAGFTFQNVNLGSWYGRQRKIYNKGKLEESRVMFLKAIGTAFVQEGGGGGGGGENSQQAISASDNSLSHAEEKESRSLQESHDRDNSRSARLDDGEEMEEGDRDDDNEEEEKDQEEGEEEEDQEEMEEEEQSGEEEDGDDNNQHSRISRKKKSPSTPWRAALDEQWMEHYNLFSKHCKEKGISHIPARTVVDGVRVGNWYHRQRIMERDGKLAPERREKLAAIGVSFDDMMSPPVKRRGSAASQASSQQHNSQRGGKSNAEDDESESEEGKSDSEIQGWDEAELGDEEESLGGVGEDGMYVVMGMEDLSEEEEEGKKKNSIPESNLNSAPKLVYSNGEELSRNDLQWEKNLAAFVDYCKKKGQNYCTISAAHNGIKIGPWYNRQRKQYNTGVLTKYRKRRMAEVKADFIDPDEVISSSDDLAMTPGRKKSQVVEKGDVRDDPDEGSDEQLSEREEEDGESDGEGIGTMKMMMRARLIMMTRTVMMTRTLISPCHLLVMLGTEERLQVN